MLFFYICWMEEYKNFIFDGIMQILLCIRSHFHHEKEQEGKIFFLWSAQDGWKHLPKHQMQVMMTFWKLVLTMSSMKYVVGKLNNSLTVCGYFMLADKLSLTGREFFPVFHPQIKVKYEIKQFFTIMYLYVWEFVKSFHPSNVTK